MCYKNMLIYSHLQCIIVLYEKYGRKRKGVSNLSKSFKKNLIFFIAVLLTVVTSASLPFFSRFLPNLINKVNLMSATADVSQYDLDEKENVYLSGEWQFFWDKHIISDGLQGVEPDAYVQVPSSWTTYEIDGKKLFNGGKASYRAVIKNVDSSVPFVVSVPNLSGRCDVYINGECVFSNRNIPGTEYSTVIESYAIPFSFENGDDKSCEVVIEMTCSFSGGLTSVPVLSSYEQYHLREMGTLAQRYFYIGIVIFIAIAVLLLGIFNKDVGEQFWLFVLCFVFAFRMLITNEGYMVSHGLFGDMDYEIMTSLVYVSTYIIKLSMLMHLINVLGIKFKQIGLVLVSGLFLICAFVPYVLYDYIYIATSYMWLQSVTYLLDAVLIYKISEKIVQKKKFATLYLVVYCVTSVGIVTENFYMNGYISQNVTYVMPISCLVFISSVVFVHFADTVEAFKQAKRAAELTKELGDMNMTLMLSQIQPHFLYNALNTIKYLTKKDPKAAESAIVKFSNYLRANMDSLTQKEPIPFTQELEHVKNYISIECLRFGERLKVEYDIQYDDFVIPPLTIQPIAENAIKHGINQRVNGGTLKISSYKEDGKIFVVIEDNGVGFNVNEKKDDGRSHVGINNIKSRLEELLHANVTVESTVGVGTKATITIPKEEK